MRKLVYTFCCLVFWVTLINDAVAKELHLDPAKVEQDVTASLKRSTGRFARIESVQILEHTFRSASNPLLLLELGYSANDDNLERLLSAARKRAERDETQNWRVEQAQATVESERKKAERKQYFVALYRTPDSSDPYLISVKDWPCNSGQWRFSLNVQCTPSKSEALQVLSEAMKNASNNKVTLTSLKNLKANATTAHDAEVVADIKLKIASKNVDNLSEDFLKMFRVLNGKIPSAEFDFTRDDRGQWLLSERSRKKIVKLLSK